ncbi:FAD-binding oxidoreductase [Actinomadura roseirufa]|uniref:FAD-binding oxidoreductase n=1 Tax=Actinomadura roseirufa TaxID=2094049 RepID=UPI001A955B6A|nr:FAD-binding oxidoreductase [Actinomadura roseirufa]
MNTNAEHFLLPGESGYDDERLGLNRAIESRPACVVAASGEQDVVAAVRLAGEQKRAVGVQATGHSPVVPADDAVLVSTRRMDGVRVDPERATAWIEAGAPWRTVLEHTTPHGLAPLNGSSPSVGAVGYLVGGGAGLLGRRFGFAADHVRRLRLVTADGRLRDVTAASDPDLFWAVRGGKDNFGLVVGMEIDLFPVARLYGGGLYFSGEATTEVLHAYAEWVRHVPEVMASSVLLATMPDLPGVPDPLRGRFIAHVRVAYSGEGGAAEGERLVRSLRQFGPALLDTVQDMPYAQVGTIHHEPTDAPYVAYDRSMFLRELDFGTVDALLELAGPDAGAPFITELRHFGGAYARTPEVPNCVGGRDALFSVFTGLVPTNSESDAAAFRQRDELLAKLDPWSTGGSLLNFAGVEDAGLDRVRTAYAPADFERLRAIKTVYDPGNMFRINFNIPPRE